MEVFYFFILISLGTVFHILFMYSMFDIFFIFPLNYGMTPHSSSLSEDEIPSNRVVIMALDGVRADVFFETIGNGLAPFLKDVIENRGVYGVSHTKVPTETKPNFIAMFSGHYSDASLALKDLYSKKVPFDSIFNESNHAWGIGNDGCIFKEVAKQMDCVPFKSIEDFSDNQSEKNDYKIFDTDKMVAVYQEMYGIEPQLEAVHAGLECGLLVSKIQDLDCVSIGPDMKNIHTTKETLSISSVERVWNYLVKLLETKDNFS